MVARKHRLPDRPTQKPFTPEQRSRLRAPPPQYNPAFAGDIIEKMADGYSLGGFAGQIGIARTTIDHWRRDYPEFDVACARAMAVRQLWWERQAIEVARTGGQGSQGQMVIFGLINAGREDWRQKQEIEHTGQLSLAALVEQSMRQINPPTIEGQATEQQAQDKPKGV
jgi:hypothetical protein